MGRFHALKAIPAGGDGFPSRIINNAQLGRVDNRPLIWRRRANALAAGLGVLKAARLIKDDSADIELVLQDAVLANAIAIDRRGRPLAAARPNDAFGVQPLRDLPRASPVEEFSIYSPNDVGLCRINFAQAALELAGGVQARDPTIAIGAAPRASTSEYTPRLPSARLISQILAIERRHCAFEANVQLADLALGEGEDAHASEGGAFEEIGNVLLIAAQSVDRLREHDVAPTCGDRSEQVIKAWTGADRAADCVVREGARNFPSFALGIIRADAKLIVDRSVALEGS